MYYFLSALLFPQDLDEYQGYQDYFLSRRRWFFGFVALTEALDVVDTLIKGEAICDRWDWNISPRIGVFILLCAVAATTRNLRFHALFVFAAVAYEISFFGPLLRYAELAEGGWPVAATPLEKSLLPPSARVMIG